MALLAHTETTLPSRWYYDPAQYERELEAVWYREWVCVGREEDIGRGDDGIVAEIGARRVIVERADGDLRACASVGRAHLAAWGGFLFVSLAETPAQSLGESLGREADALRHWPLASLRCAHREHKLLACNWKVFWENYSECYHCPGLHPELCRIVPLYRKGVLNHADLPGWRPRDPGDDGRPTVGPGHSSWTLDGRPAMPAIDGLDERERAAGMAFASFTASMFVVGHPDYVRSVRMLPRGPESIELMIDWLLPAATVDTRPAALDHLLALGRLVVEQDGAVCELNQRGLHSRRHRDGVLVPQEYELHAFHEWLRGKLAHT